MRITTQYFTLTFLVFYSIRILAFIWSYDAFGDFFIEIQNAMTWVSAPLENITSIMSDQVRALYTYLIGIGLIIWNDPVSTPRLISLIFALLTFFPFLLMCREYFTSRVAYLALFLFSFFTLHIKFAAIPADDSLFIFLIVTSVAFLFKYASGMQIKFLIFSGISIGTASIVRPEGFLMLLLLPFLWLDTPSDAREFFDVRSHLFQATAVMLISAIMLVVTWVTFSYLMVDRFPASIFTFKTANINNLISSQNTIDKSVAIIALSTFPGILFASLTPLVFLGALWGIMRSFKNRKYRALFIASTLFFFLTVLFSKQSMVKNATVYGVFLIPYAAYGFYSFHRRFLNRKAIRGILFIALASFIWIYTILVYERGPRSHLTEKLWTISPIGYLQPEVKEIIDFFNDDAIDAQSILIDDAEDKRIKPIMLYAMDDGRVFISATRLQNNVNPQQNAANSILEQIKTIGRAEYIVCVRESNLDQEFETQAENPKHDQRLSVRLLLSNRYYRIYKLDN
ncbi:MAG: hypothetical protein DWQ10_05545 [Calditrichaeota bacterium]|nr:MAG: hypothetical protein DWQ10_05545 [Calditrichota bacterium]